MPIGGQAISVEIDQKNFGKIFGTSRQKAKRRSVASGVGRRRRASLFRPSP
jgi:hypothetical protein